MSAFRARVAALFHLVLLILLEPIHNWYRRTWCFYDQAPSDIKELNAAFELAMKAMKGGVDKAQEVAERAEAEVKKMGTITGETNQKLTEVSAALKPLSEALDEVKERVKDAEQKLSKRGGSVEQEKSVGEIFAESEELKDMVDRKMGSSKAVKVGSLRSMKAQIVNATGSNQPLVPAARPFSGILFAPEQRLTIRDLMPVIPISSNTADWVKETLFTNSAGPQWDSSSPDPHQEGALKPESGITFERVTTAVTTLAHWIPVSRQILDDVPQLRAYINMRLMYGLKLEEEDELLNGTGTNGTLNGLKNQDTAFTGGVTNANAIDTLLRAITQVRLSFYEPNGIILHPTDWMNIALLKDSEGRYLFGNPHTSLDTTIWAKPVVATVSQTLGEFTVGAFDRAAVLLDREDATIRVSEHHDDFFIRNLVAILAEERIALAVTRPAAIVSGNLSHAG